MGGRAKSGWASETAAQLLIYAFSQDSPVTLFVAIQQGHETNMSAAFDRDRGRFDNLKLPSVFVTGVAGSTRV